MAQGPNPTDPVDSHYGSYSYKGDSRGGAYYYGDSGYGYEGESKSVRTIGDYIAMFRERVWWLFISLFVWIVAVGFYCIHATPQYSAWSRLQLLRQANKTFEFNQVDDRSIRSSEDFNTEISILEGVTLAQNVERRLKEPEKRALLAPYLGQSGFTGDAPTPFGVIMAHRSIEPLRGTLMIIIRFEHPDREVAAKVANLFAEEYIAYRRSRGTETTMRAVDELQSQLDAQGKKVSELEMQMSGMKESYNTLSLDASTDINQQELMTLTGFATSDKRALDEITSVWDLVERYRREGKNMWDVPAIASDPRIPTLLQSRTNSNIEIASLSQIYGEKHPKMIDARRRLAEINGELNNAIDGAIASLQNNLRAAQDNYAAAVKRIEDKQAERLQLEKIRPEYDRLRRDLEGARNHYDYLYSRKQQTMAMSTDEGSARIIDYAYPPTTPSSPRIFVNIMMAVLLGFGTGIAIITLFVILDDKIKSSFDVEKNLNLNIIGVIPRIPKTSPNVRARIVASGLHQQTLEAFRSIHSSLKLNDEARNAKVILVTSTIPSEGKSFVATNLALIHAAHGEKVIVVDGDLRMPNVAKSLAQDNNRGVLTIMSGKTTLDDTIIRSVENNFDVLPAGGNTNSPSKILCSEAFDNMLQELRRRYDKVFVDSPPLAPVSDTLNIVPKADGIVYVIRFNTVKRKTASVCLKRLAEAKIPILGSIMNNVAGQQIAYYYSNYYDRSYSHYYGNHKDGDSSQKSGRSHQGKAHQTLPDSGSGKDKS